METQFIDKAVNKNAVNNYFKKAHETGNNIHTIQICKDNKCMLRIAQHPYSCTDAREVYSLSKTFTSTVVGIASDMGLLSVEDKVLDYFPEIKTDNEYFKALKIKHVLSMNTGHKQCVMPEMRLLDKPFEGFFSVLPEYEPGTHFAYNTGATCLLGQIINRVTGKHFFDFACEKLFYPMGIYNVSWSRCHDGSSQCGVGLHISNDDILKLGILYLNNGVYNGKRIVSEEWIKEAQSAISDNSGNGTVDWSSGYEYQIWVNARDGFRGDGAMGQLCMVLPKYNAVVAVQGYVKNMQEEIDAVYELLDNLEGDDGVLEEYKFETYGKQTDVRNIDRVFRLDENLPGFKYLHVMLDNEQLRLSFSDSAGIQTICAGNGEWIKSSYQAKHMIPCLNALMTTEFVENIKTAGCYKIDGDKITVCLRYLSNPHTEEFEINLDKDGITIDFNSDLRIPEIKHFSGVNA